MLVVACITLCIKLFPYVLQKIMDTWKIKSRQKWLLKNASTFLRLFIQCIRSKCTLDYSALDIKNLFFCCPWGRKSAQVSSSPWYLISPKYITTVEILHCALSGVDFMMIGCNGWDILFSFVNRGIQTNVSILKKKSACSKSACSKKKGKKQTFSGWLTSRFLLLNVI